MKLIIILSILISFTYAQEDQETKGDNDLLAAPVYIQANDVTSVMLNQTDFLRVTHTKTLVHPESFVLKDKEKEDYIFNVQDKGKVEVYEGKYPNASYWFTTKIFRSHSNKVLRVEEIIRDGVDYKGRKKVLANIVNFDGYELQNRTLCEGYIAKIKVDEQYKRFMASEDINKKYPQVVLQCHTFSEGMCQQFERIKKINQRFEVSKTRAFTKFFDDHLHKEWIQEIMDGHSYQTTQKDNFISMKMAQRPGGRGAQIYWPSNITHHQYQGHKKADNLSDDTYEFLQKLCKEHVAYIAPAPEYIREPADSPQDKSNNAAPAGGGVNSNGSGVAMNQ